MPKFEIIVTDVTCYSDLFCVAGWDRKSGVMVRPEPPGANVNNEASRFWGAQFAGPSGRFSPGNIVGFDAASPPADFPFPHATEDRLVPAGEQIAVLGHVTSAQMVAEVAASVSPSLQAAFDHGLVHAPSRKAYVPPGHQGRSLGAVEIAPNKVRLHEATSASGKRQLRAILTDGETPYDLSITAEAARARWIADGIGALRADLNASARIHVRVGLARPTDELPCYAQINGLYFL